MAPRNGHKRDWDEDSTYAPCAISFRGMWRGYRLCCMVSRRRRDWRTPVSDTLACPIMFTFLTLATSPSWTYNHLHYNETTLLIALHQQSLPVSFPILMCAPSWRARRAPKEEEDLSTLLNVYKFHLQKAGRNFQKMDNMLTLLGVIVACFYKGKQMMIAENMSSMLFTKELFKKSKNALIKHTSTVRSSHFSEPVKRLRLFSRWESTLCSLDFTCKSDHPVMAQHSDWPAWMHGLKRHPRIGCTGDMPWFQESHVMIYFERWRNWQQIR